MALRYWSMVVAINLLITSGCRSSSNYRAPCQQPAVVATTPAPCATAPTVVPPPPGTVIVPR